MEIINIGSGQLNDSITGELSYMAVRVADNSIGIVLSQESSGDAEIFIDADDCKLLIEWLNTAIIKAKNVDSG